MSKTILKPCPFCGGQSSVHRELEFRSIRNPYPVHKVRYQHTAYAKGDSHKAVEQEGEKCTERRVFS